MIQFPPAIQTGEIFTLFSRFKVYSIAMSIISKSNLKLHVCFHNLIKSSVTIMLESQVKLARMKI